MEKTRKPSRGTLPWWALFAVLALGPFGLLPIALSGRTDRATRLMVALPILFATVPLVVLGVVVATRLT